MIPFLTFFVFTCIGAHCESSAPIADQASAEERYEGETKKWFMGRASLWAIQCSRGTAAAPSEVDKYYMLSTSKPWPVFGCDKIFVNGGAQ